MRGTEGSPPTRGGYLHDMRAMDAYPDVIFVSYSRESEGVAIAMNAYRDRKSGCSGNRQRRLRAGRRDRVGDLGGCRPPKIGEIDRVGDIPELDRIMAKASTEKEAFFHRRFDRSARIMSAVGKPSAMPFDIVETSIRFRRTLEDKALAPWLGAG